MTEHAGAVDTARVAGEVVVPTLASGVLRRRPRVMAVADRLQFDRKAVRLLRTLRARYGPGPLLLRIPGRSVAVLLEPGDVGRVLGRTPSPFSPAAWEKRAALAHFQPHAVLTTPMPQRAPRRRYNETVLQSGREIHSLGPRIQEVVREETTHLLDHGLPAGAPLGGATPDRDGAGTTELSWDAFATAWWRIVRRIVLGDAARDDTEVTDELAALRLRGNWAFLLPKAARRRERFRARLAAHLDRAEQGSLAGVIADSPAEQGVDPHGQVPHWLFAFDAAGMTTLRTLALLATHPDEAARAREDLGTPGDERLPYLRACVLETVRLWPTTPVLLRQSTTATSWRGTQLPPGTLFVAFAPYFHRAPELVPFADRFRPRVWLNGEADADACPGLVPFSAGPGRCPGENLVLFVASTMLAELLRHGEYRLLAPRVLLARSHAHDRLPATVDNFGIRLRHTPGPVSQGADGLGRPEGSTGPEG